MNTHDLVELVASRFDPEHLNAQCLVNAVEPSRPDVLKLEGWDDRNHYRYSEGLP